MMTRDWLSHRLGLAFDEYYDDFVQYASMYERHRPTIVQNHSVRAGFKTVFLGHTQGWDTYTSKSNFIGLIHEYPWGPNGGDPNDNPDAAWKDSVKLIVLPTLRNVVINAAKRRYPTALVRVFRNILSH